jgi:hypothetical protein
MLAIGRGSAYTGAHGGSNVQIIILLASCLSLAGLRDGEVIERGILESDAKHARSVRQGVPICRSRAIPSSRGVRTCCFADAPQDARTAQLPLARIFSRAPPLDGKKGAWYLQCSAARPPSPSSHTVIRSVPSHQVGDRWIAVCTLASVSRRDFSICARRLFIQTST